MHTFKVKPIHPADAPEITLTADTAVIDSQSGRINFYVGEDCVGSFINATFYKVDAV